MEAPEGAEIRCAPEGRDRSLSIGGRYTRHASRWLSASSAPSHRPEHYSIAAADSTDPLKRINFNQCTLVPPEDEMLAKEESCRLLYYFQWLEENRSFDISFDYMSELIEKNSDICAIDDENVTVLHYAAASWECSVAEFIIKEGCPVNSADNKGRTPLHIAAYLNHTEMIEFLLMNGAQLNQRCCKGQSAVHYAVRASSLEALHMLIVEKDALYDHDCLDSEGRTPLQLGAELDRTKAVQFLLDLSLDVVKKLPSRCDVYDNSGYSALTSMIINMPQMALLGLDQLHKLIPDERKQEYLISRIESAEHKIKTPFEAAVEWNVPAVLTHPVMKKLVDVKWTKVARRYYLLSLAAYLLYLIVWSALIVYPPIQEKHLYDLPQDIWRIVLGGLGMALLIFQIFNEVGEFLISYNKGEKYVKWLRERLQFDLEHCKGAEFKEEFQYIEEKLASTMRRSRYFSEAWNIIDNFGYFLLILITILHIVDVINHTTLLALWNARIASVAVILIWAKLLFFARASKLLGPMIAVFTHIRGKLVQYFFVFMVFYTPFAIDFWLLFGGDQQLTANVTVPSPELSSAHRTFVVLFRMSIIDDYPYEAIRDVDEVSATLFTVAFLVITAIIGLNILIALLSETFQRVYDNAAANAEYQRAKLILSLADKKSAKRHKDFLRYISKQCNPASDFYNDDDEMLVKTMSISKITHQTHTLVQDLALLIDKQQKEIQESIQQMSSQIVAATHRTNPQSVGAAVPSVAGPTKLPPLFTPLPAMPSALPSVSRALRRQRSLRKSVKRSSKRNKEGGGRRRLERVPATVAEGEPRPSVDCDNNNDNFIV